VAQLMGEFPPPAGMRVGVAVEYEQTDDGNDFELGVKVLNLSADPDEAKEQMLYLLSLAIASYAPELLKDDVAEALLSPYEVVSAKDAGA